MNCWLCQQNTYKALPAMDLSDNKSCYYLLIPTQQYFCNIKGTYQLCSLRCKIHRFHYIRHIFQVAEITRTWSAQTSFQEKYKISARMCTSSWIYRGRIIPFAVCISSFNCGNHVECCSFWFWKISNSKTVSFIIDFA